MVFVIAKVTVFCHTFIVTVIVKLSTVLVIAIVTVKDIVTLSQSQSQSLSYEVIVRVTAILSQSLSIINMM